MTGSNQPSCPTTRTRTLSTITQILLMCLVPIAQILRAMMLVRRLPRTRQYATCTEATNEYGGSSTSQTLPTSFDLSRLPRSTLPRPARMGPPRGIVCRRLMQIAKYWKSQLTKTSTQEDHHHLHATRWASNDRDFSNRGDGVRSWLRADVFEGGPTSHARENV